jgi:hypothetical protein
MYKHQALKRHISRASFNFIARAHAAPRWHSIAEDGLDGLEKIVGTLNDISTAALWAAAAMPDFTSPSDAHLIYMRVIEGAYRAAYVGLPFRTNGQCRFELLAATEDFQPVGLRGPLFAGLANENVAAGDGGISQQNDSGAGS